MLTGYSPLEVSGHLIIVHDFGWSDSYFMSSTLLPVMPLVDQAIEHDTTYWISGMTQFAFSLRAHRHLNIGMVVVNGFSPHIRLNTLLTLLLH